MVNSITFPLEGTGYIYRKLEAPIKPDRNYREFRNVDKSEFRAAMNKYKKEMNYFRVHEGEFVLPAAKNIIGKTFNFRGDKINVIFGPNASGKSTILRAIAGNALCTDGFTSIAQPMDLPWRYVVDDSDTSNEALEFVRGRRMKNNASVDWSGNPIYYDTFKETERKGQGMFGELIGSVFESAGEEGLYHIIAESSSAGQRSVYIFNKLIQRTSKLQSLENIIGGTLERYSSGNAEWSRAADIQRKYIESFPDYHTPQPTTILLDEIDQSLDITNTIDMYTRFFPELIEKTGSQIIVISHSPVILSKAIRFNDMYNIIPIDEEYYDSAVRSVEKIF